MNKHECELDSPYAAYGEAVTHCYEHEDCTYWVCNEEYSSQVNFCPVCGAKAPVQIKEKNT